MSAHVIIVKWCLERRVTRLTRTICVFLVTSMVKNKLRSHVKAPLYFWLNSCRVKKKIYMWKIIVGAPLIMKEKFTSVNEITWNRQKSVAVCHIVIDKPKSSWENVLLDSWANTGAFWQDAKMKQGQKKKPVWLWNWACFATTGTGCPKYVPAHFWKLGHGSPSSTMT